MIPGDNLYIVAANSSILLKLCFWLAYYLPLSWLESLIWSRQQDGLLKDRILSYLPAYLRRLFRHIEEEEHIKDSFMQCVYNMRRNALPPPLPPFTHKQLISMVMTSIIIPLLATLALQNPEGWCRSRLNVLCQSFPAFCQTLSSAIYTSPSTPR